MIEVLYSSALRVSELVNLKKENIDSYNNIITIREAKGKKDRITILSKKVKEELLKYFRSTQFKTLHKLNELVTA